MSFNRQEYMKSYMKGYQKDYRKGKRRKKNLQPVDEVLNKDILTLYTIVEEHEKKIEDSEYAILDLKTIKKNVETMWEVYLENK